jgi:MoaA/NifB/PqqE/SkfB family radical SAM enzyme
MVIFKSIPHFVFYIKYLSLKKATNYLLLSLSFFLSRFCKRVIYWGKPAFLSIEPTNVCNLKCLECPTGMGVSITPKGFADLNFTKQIANNSEYILSVNLYFQGEPFLHKQLCDIIKQFSEKSVFSILSTNAHFFNVEIVNKILDSGLNKIIVSVDGYNSETYKEYRVGGSFDKVVSGIKLLADTKQQRKQFFPIIEMQTLLLKTTENNISEIKQLSKSLSVDKLVFKTAQFYDFENISKLMPTEKNSRYKISENNGLQIKNKMPNYCWRAWSGRVVTWNGNIIPCCFDKDWKHSYATVSKELLNSKFTNRNTLLFMTKIFTNRNKIDICKNCTEGIRK